MITLRFGSASSFFCKCIHGDVHSDVTEEKNAGVGDTKRGVLRIITQFGDFTTTATR